MILTSFFSQNKPYACAIKIPITSGNLNIRIHRDIEDLPPSERIHPGGRRAFPPERTVRYGQVGGQDVVWGGIDMKRKVRISLF